MNSTIKIFNTTFAAVLYKQGYSLRHLSNLFGISRLFIRKSLVCNGENIRTRNCQLFIDSEKRGLYSYFDAIDSHEKAYWLGFILADGNVSSNKRTMEIGLSRRDADHLQKFASLFREFVTNTPSKSRYAIYSVYMCHRLVDLGIQPRKSYVDDLSIFGNVPFVYMNSFLLGLLDGDGSVDTYRELIRVSFHGRHALMTTVRDIFVKILGVHNNKVGKDKSIFRVQWSGNQALKILDWLYKDSPIHLERKYLVYKGVVEYGKCYGTK